MEHIGGIIDDVMERFAAQRRWRREADDIRRYLETVGQAVWIDSEPAPLDLEATAVFLQCDE